MCIRDIGYTAKVAGTEKGLGNKPEATFSTCFGAPFMPRRPTVYGEMLRDRLAKHKGACWLVNTGWSGGSAGDGAERMKIAHTRAMLRAALDGSLSSVSMSNDNCFGLNIPEQCPEVPADILQPRKAWKNPKKYDVVASDLCWCFTLPDYFPGGPYGGSDGLADPSGFCRSQRWITCDRYRHGSLLIQFRLATSSANKQKLIVKLPYELNSVGEH